MMRPLLLMIVVFFSACSREEYFGPVYLDNEDTISIADSARLLIGCEGNFQYGNASLSLYDLNTGENFNDVFRTINNAELGDVLQSIHVSGDSVYLVLNNSGLIRILNTETLKQVDVIDGLTSPRHVQVIPKKRLLVSDIYSDELSVYDLKSRSLVKTIPVEGWTERILVWDAARILVANLEKRSLAVLDAQLLEVKQTVELGFIPHFITRAAGGELIIAGNRSEKTNTGVVKVFDPQTMTPGDSMVLSGPLVSISVEDNTLYLLTRHEVEVLDASSLQPQSSWGHTLQTPYAMYLDPASGDLFLADARDYLSNGRVFHYSAQGTLVTDFETGIIPQAMVAIP